MQETTDRVESADSRGWMPSASAGPTSGRRPVVVAVAAVLLLLSHCLMICAGSEGLRIKINRIESTDIPRVRCFVSVTNSVCEPIGGLSTPNFSLAEQGKPISGYRVSSVSKDSTHAAIVLVIDKSGSMKGHAIRSAVVAAKDFIGRLSVRDQVSVIPFSDSIGPETPLTTDRGAAQAALTGIVARGETRLFDSALRAVEYVAASDARRKAVLILTDGKDTGSRASASGCIARARDAGVSLYCIGLGSGISRAVLGGLAEKTGGRVYTARDPDDLVDIYRGIAALLLHEYTLTYETPLVRGKPYWRNVVVKVSYHGTMAESAKQYVVSSERVSSSSGSDPSLPQIPPVGILICAFVGLNLILLVALLVRRIGRNSE
jgi:VWFA-related protein